MLEILEGMRLAILGDPYLNKTLTPDKVRVSHISELGQTPPLPCITLQEISGSEHPSGIGLGFGVMQVDIWSGTGYSEVFNLYNNRSQQVCNLYGYPRGIRTLFHGQRLVFQNGIRFFSTEVDRIQRRDTSTGLYNLTLRYSYILRDGEAANVQTWVQ